MELNLAMIPLPAKLWFVEESVVGGSLFSLSHTGRFPFANHVDSFGHSFDALRIHETLVNRVHRLIRTDVALPLSIKHKSVIFKFEGTRISRGLQTHLQEERTGVQSCVRVEYRESALGVSFNQSPTDCRGSPVACKKFSD